MSNRYERELVHDRKILEDADKVWGRMGRVGEFRIERRAQTIIEACQIKPGMRVLELGCGTGKFTGYLAQTGAQVTAIDLFEGFLEIAKRYVDSLNVDFRVGQAENLSGLPDESFDVVCGVSVLHHLEIHPALASMHRVLKRGGRIGFSEPNMLNPQIAMQKNIHWLKEKLGDAPDETAFFKWQMKKLLEAVNFREIKVWPFDFLHPATPDFFSSAVIDIGYFLEKVPFLREIAGSLFIFAKK